MTAPESEVYSCHLVLIYAHCIISFSLPLCSSQGCIALRRTAQNYACHVCKHFVLQFHSDGVVVGLKSTKPSLDCVPEAPYCFKALPLYALRRFARVAVILSVIHNLFFLGEDDL